MESAVYQAGLSTCLLVSSADHYRPTQSSAKRCNRRELTTLLCGGLLRFSRRKKVTDYADHLGALPPVVAFYDGTDYWLADGFHRVAAHALAKRESVTVDVRQGSRRDAILYSVGANNDHGLRRTPADKQRAVMALVSDDEWGKRSVKFIADTCNVSQGLVSKLKAEYSGSRSRTGDDDEPQKVIGRDGIAQSASKKKPAPVAQPAEEAVKSRTIPAQHAEGADAVEPSTLREPQPQHVADAAQESANTHPHCSPFGRQRDPFEDDRISSDEHAIDLELVDAVVCTRASRTFEMRRRRRARYAAFPQSTSEIRKFDERVIAAGLAKHGMRPDEVERTLQLEAVPEAVPVEAVAAMGRAAKAEKGGGSLSHHREGLEKSGHATTERLRAITRAPDAVKDAYRTGRTPPRFHEKR